MDNAYQTLLGQFQSTPSARRATRVGLPESVGREDFNPRPPRGERRVLATKEHRSITFQSTPSARRATDRRSSGLPSCRNFNPRPPRGERRFLCHVIKVFVPISIHALREESDPAPPGSTPSQTDFNPRPPRGGRRVNRCACWTEFQFQSTPSARRATWQHYADTDYPPISIHALREEGDSWRCSPPSGSF